MSKTKSRTPVAGSATESLEPRALFSFYDPMMMPMFDPMMTNMTMPAMGSMSAMPAMATTPTMGASSVGPLIDYGTPPPTTNPGSNNGGGGTTSGTPKHRNKHDSFTRQDLVSDGGVPATRTDPNLVNAWGLALNPVGFWWVANNGTGTSSQLDASGNPAPDGSGTPASVTIPNGGAVTGVVFNGGGGFAVSAGGLSGPSRFIYVTEDGTIAGWSPNVSVNNAVLAVDRSAEADHPIYKGVAIASAGGQDRLFAADFHNGRIDAFDGNFNPVTTTGGFQDPKLPQGFAPFNVQNIGGNVFVTYAKQDADREDELHGKGLGVIDVFDADGNLVRRFAKKGKLNAPWGLAQAPADFGKFSNDVIVGNFGDGEVMAFDAKGKFKGLLRDAGTNKPVQIDGLWGLGFGNGLQAGPTNTLFFAAGPNDEANGLFGSLTLAT